MNHRLRIFYPYKGMFLHIEVKVCERLLSQLPESAVMKYKSKIHNLVEEFYNVLASVKCEIEQCEAALNETETHQETHQEIESRKVGGLKTHEL